MTQFSFVWSGFESSPLKRKKCSSWMASLQRKTRWSRRQSPPAYGVRIQSAEPLTRWLMSSSLNPLQSLTIFALHINQQPLNERKHTQKPRATQRRNFFFSRSCIFLEFFSTSFSFDSNVLGRLETSLPCTERALCTPICFEICFKSQIAICLAIIGFSSSPLQKSLSGANVDFSHDKTTLRRF